MKRKIYITLSLVFLLTSSLLTSNCSKTNNLNFDAKNFSSQLGAEKTLDLTKLTYYFQYDTQTTSSYTLSGDQSVTSIKNIIDDTRWDLTLASGNVFLSSNCIKTYSCFNFSTRATSTFETQLGLNSILKSGTLFIVAKLSEGNLIAWGSDYNQNSITLGKENNLGVVRVFSDSANYKERFFTIPADTASIFIITFRDDNIVSIMVDGVIPGVSANVIGSNPTYSEVTRKWILGSSNSKGSIGEISLTPSTLTKAQMRAASNFLARKWSLTTRISKGSNFASGEAPPLGGNDDSLNGGDGSGGGTGEETPMSFATDIKPLLQSRCIACHTAWAGDYNQLISSARIIPNNAGASTVYTRVYNNSMPPSGSGNPLNNTEKDKIYKWIMQGAKNN